MIVAVILASPGLAGCGLVAQTVSTEAPGAIRRILPEEEWREIKANQTAGLFGVLLVGVRVTMPAGASFVNQSVDFLLVPYADGLRSDLETLLRWKHDDGVSPQVVARRRDAERHITEALEIFRDALIKGGVQNLFRDQRIPLKGEARVDGLPAGAYLLFSEYRNMEASACWYCKNWAWVERVRVDPSGMTRVVLDEDNALCLAALGSSALGWTWQSRCRAS